MSDQIPAEDPVRADVDAGFDDWLIDLLGWLRIPSVSADPLHHADVARSAAYLAATLRRTGFPTVQVWDDTAALPAVYAHWPSSDSDALRVVVYGHHDVQPADGEERWNYPPFEPRIVDGVLHGRGASDDKGNIFMHLLGVRAHLAATGRTAPAVDLTLLVEGEEESGSPHIGALLAAHAAQLPADLIVVTDTGMFDAATPSVCVGMRGLVSGELHVHGPGVDLHSGSFGGAVLNPLAEMCRLVAALHDGDRFITVPGFYDGVMEPTEAERAATAALPFDEAGWLTGAARSRAAHGEAGWSTLERVGSRPTAEVNGMWGGYTGPGGKTIVPTDATAKLTFRLVGRQDPAAVQRAVSEFFTTRADPGAQVEMVWDGAGVRPLSVDPTHPATVATAAALSRAFDGQAVLFTREGGSGPEAELAEAMAAPVVFIGVMTDTDQIHAPNENARLDPLRRGCTAIGHLWSELAGLDRDFAAR